VTRELREEWRRAVAEGYVPQAIFAAEDVIAICDDLDELEAENARLRSERERSRLLLKQAYEAIQVQARECSWEGVGLSRELNSLDGALCREPELWRYEAPAQ
jgi:hypothetical protein